MAHFEYSSVINAPCSEVFDFCSNLNRLSEYTPPEYKIEFVSPVQLLEKNQEYELKISRFGISLYWSIIIEDVVKGQMFRDRQTMGPFSLWIHTHKFSEHESGTVVSDVIEYDLPYGVLGKLMTDLWVRRELEKNFRYRHQRLQELLSTTA